MSLMTASLALISVGFSLDEKSTSPPTACAAWRAGRGRACGRALHARALTTGAATSAARVLAELEPADAARLHPLQVAVGAGRAAGQRREGGGVLVLLDLDEPVGRGEAVDLLRR